VFAAVALPVIGGLALAIAFPAGGTLVPEDLAKHFPGLLSQAPRILAILLGAAAMLALGWIDDRRGLSAALRLAVQVAAAGLLVLAGVRITAYSPSVPVHALLTILFVVFATNATNFIDNMNGLLAGVGAIQAACFLAIAASSGQLFVAAVLICIAGGLLAFLPRNFPKATVFLGDAGSLAIGFLISAMTIACDFEHGAVSMKPVIMPLLILFVPLLDGVVVMAARLLSRRSPFEAGRDHLSHRLNGLGLTRDRAVVYLWGLSLLAGAVALVYDAIPLPVVLLTVGPVVVCIAWVARSAE
jgi:UDP-GlcNAc:undecaprenyl-phosphate GlcNAc-1-phosphate transferase